MLLLVTSCGRLVRLRARIARFVALFTLVPIFVVLALFVVLFVTLLVVLAFLVPVELSLLVLLLASACGNGGHAMSCEALS